MILESEDFTTQDIVDIVAMLSKNSSENGLFVFFFNYLIVYSKFFNFVSKKITSIGSSIKTIDDLSVPGKTELYESDTLITVIQLSNIFLIFLIFKIIQKSFFNRCYKIF